MANPLPMKQFDFLVLGSGIAGLTFALKVAPRGRGGIITKKNRAESNTNYAQGRIAELMELGMNFSEREIPESHGAKELDLGKEGGHSKRRILHAKDVTGREIERALLTAVAREPNIEIFENHLAIDLITTQKLRAGGANHCLGVYVLDKRSGRVETFAAPATLLATGGCGKVYLYTTNPDIATGDGVAMAYRAGA